MSLIVPLITFPYSSRVLGPESIGKVNFSISIIDYFTLLAELGIGSQGLREISKFRNNREELTKVTGELFSFYLITTAISYSIFIITLFNIPKFADYKILLLICSTAVLIKPLSMEFLYTGLEDFGYITGRTLLFQIFSICLLFLTVKDTNHYFQYASIIVISSTGSNILNFIHARKYINYKNLFNNLNLQRHIKPILVFFFITIASKLYKIVDNSMIGFMCNDYQVGLYVASEKISNMILSIVTACSAILLPRLTYVIQNESRDNFNILIKKGFDVLFLFAIPCTIGLFLESDNLTILMSGKKYAEAIPIMKILTPIILITGISNFIGGQVFIPLNKENKSLFSVICGTIINISINIFLIPKYGAKGAAIGTIISESIVLIIRIPILAKEFNLLPIFKIFLVYLFNSTIMALFVYISIKFIKNEILGLIISILIGIIIYMLLLLIEKNSLLINIINEIVSKVKCKKIT